MSKINRFYLYILFISILSSLIFSTNCLAQKKLLFGLNAPFTDPVLQDIISKTQPSMQDLLKNYHVQYLRYPGGIPTRYYFWDRADLTGSAMKIYSKYLDERGDKRKEYYSNYSENVTASTNNYKEFLEFCSNNKVTPIIEFNTAFYVNNNKIYQIEKFQKQKSEPLFQNNRWEKIEEYLINQMNFTHSIVDEVLWEFGNEDYFMFDPDEYANIVMNFINTVHKTFPKDKIIVEMSNSWSKGARKKQWNKTFIANIEKKGGLNKIDYFAPHFYDNGGEQYDNTDQMKAKINKNNTSAFEEATLSSFPEGFKPKLFFTEFAAVMTSLDNKNYNTQMHALLYLNYYMRFFASPYIAGIIQHTFTTLKAGFFYSPLVTDRLKYITDKNTNSNLIKYIPPQTEAIKLFFDSVGENLFSFYPTDNFLLLITESNKKYYVQILNFDDNSQTVTFNNILNLIEGRKGSVNTYSFNDLNAHYWYPSKAIQQSEINSTQITVPKHSFTTIKY